MWLITTFGFFSAVQKPGDTLLTVRARVKGDLEALREKYAPTLGEITESGGTDYPFRARISHADFAEAVRMAALDIRYDNFKNEVARVQGWEREGVYGKVWGVLRNLETRR